MSTPPKQITVTQPTRSRPKPKSQLQRARTKKTDKSPTKQRKLPTRPAVVSPAESGKTSRPRAARKTTSYYEDIDSFDIFGSDSEEEQPPPTMLAPEEVPPPSHEIETVERSSIEGKGRKADKAFKKALMNKATEREPVKGHEQPLPRNLSNAQKASYTSKFRRAFPHATPTMMRDVEKVLNGEPHVDADAKLDVIIPNVKVKAPPKQQAEIGNGEKGVKRTEHDVRGLENPYLPSRRMALYALAYFTFHRLLRDTCLVVKDEGVQRKPQCKCASHFCNDLRNCLDILGGKDDIIAVKLFKIAAIPMITELVESQRMIIDGDNDEEAYNRYTYGKIFCRVKLTSNPTPHTIFQIAGRDHGFCASTAMEVLGRQTSQAVFQNFINQWIMNNWHFMKIVRIRGQQSKMTRFALECVADRGEPKTWLEVAKDSPGRKNKLKFPKLVYKLMEEKGMLIGIEMDYTEFSKHMRKLRAVYDPMVQAQALVIANPNCRQQFEGQLGEPFWSILFRFKGQLSYRSGKDLAVMHMCDGGAVWVAQSSPFMKALLERFLCKAGPGGRKDLSAPPHQHRRLMKRKRKGRNSSKKIAAAGGESSPLHPTRSLSPNLLPHSSSCTESMVPLGFYSRQAM